MLLCRSAAGWSIGAGQELTRNLDHRIYIYPALERQIHFILRGLGFRYVFVPACAHNGLLDSAYVIRISLRDRPDDI